MSVIMQCRIFLYVLKQSIIQPTFNQFNPNDIENYCRYPNKMNSYLLHNQPVFFAPKLFAWMCSLNQRDTVDLAKNPIFSHNFHHWKFSPKPVAKEKQNDLQRLASSGLTSVSVKEHKRIRRLVKPDFLPKNLHKLEVHIVSSVDTALKDLPQSVNFVDFTSKVPLVIMANILGVPHDYGEAFEGLAALLLAKYNPMIKYDPELAMSGLSIVRQVVKDRRESPKDDFVSVLVQKADESRDRLSIDEVMSFIATMLTVASGTTTNYLNFALQ